ncbi:hypothetical protein MKX01_025538 [Papaver californicum]|nr:hypothetical protein MKX01_025538 [Papaver californicum]
MAPSMNRFGVVLLVLIASTSFFVDKAQAYGFQSCMNVCGSSYLICFNYCLGSSLGYNKQLSSVEKHSKYSHSKHSRSVKHGHSKHSKHAHH